MFGIVTIGAVDYLLLDHQLLVLAPTRLERRQIHDVGKPRAQRLALTLDGVGERRIVQTLRAMEEERWPAGRRWWRILTGTRPAWSRSPRAVVRHLLAEAQIDERLLEYAVSRCVDPEGKIWLVERQKRVG